VSGACDGAGSCVGSDGACGDLVVIHCGGERGE
jgi:hypothetical protein